MRFGLYLTDLRRERTDSHGVINYALGLARSLPMTLKPHESLVLYANPEIAHELKLETRSANVDVRVQSLPAGGAGRLWSDHGRSVLAAIRDGVSVLHFPKGYVPLVKPRGLRIIATLHDDIATRYARAAQGRRGNLKAKYFAWATSHSIEVSDHVITVSDFSLRRLQEVAANHRIRMPPTTVTYEGVTLPQRPFTPISLRQPCLAHLASRFPHKRSAEAVTMALRYVEERRAPWRLLVIGEVDEVTEQILNRPNVDRIRSVLSNEELATMLSRARALLFNSEYEGFGLPPVEAYSLGTPATYPQAAAMPEVMNGAPGGFRLGDYHDFARALDEALLLDESQLLALQHVLRVRYNWRAVAERTVLIYRT